MKKLWFLFLSSLGLPIRRVSVLGESVPKVIHDKFFRLYPNAYNISWYVRRGIYEARFMDSNYSADTFFKPDGEVLKQFKITKFSELPKDVVKNILKDASGYSVVDVLVDEYHNDPKFKITFRKEKHLFETECDSQGNTLTRVEI